MKILVSGATKAVRRLATTYPDHLGVLLTPADWHATESILSTGLAWAADNGCFGGLDDKAFRRMLNRIAGLPRLQWVVCPDQVADAGATLRLFDEWEPVLRSHGVPIAFVAQNGQEKFDVPWDRFDALFLGGAETADGAEWKLSQAAIGLASAAKAKGKLLHVGRVNSLRRLKMTYDMGADSVDGSSLSKWANTYLEQFLGVTRQLECQLSLLDPLRNCPVASR